MFRRIRNIFRIGRKKDLPKSNSKDTAKERLHLVLMQDRANVSADFLDLMREEIIGVIKKYIEVDESAIDVRLTSEVDEDGKQTAPALYANIPIKNIKDERYSNKSRTNERESTEILETNDKEIDKEDIEQQDSEQKLEEVIEEAKTVIEEVNGKKQDEIVEIEVIENHNLEEDTVEEIKEEMKTDVAEKPKAEEGQREKMHNEDNKQKEKPQDEVEEKVDEGKKEVDAEVITEIAKEEAKEKPKKGTVKKEKKSTPKNKKNSPKENTISKRGRKKKNVEEESDNEK